MPTYDFECTKCKHLLERFVLMAERTKQKCPLCEAAMISLLSGGSGSAVIWKPDWYWVNSDEKVFVRSKAQLFEECRKRGKYSVGYGQENNPSDRAVPDGGLKSRAEVVNQEAALWDNCQEE